LPTNQLAVSEVADWSIRGLDNSLTDQLANMFDAKFGQNNSFKCGIYKFTVSKLTSQRLD